MATEQIRQLLQSGIEAARKGDRVTARRYLRQVVDQAPNNEMAWIWLASVAETIGQRREYLEQVIRINPNNERAQEALERIRSTASVSDTPSPTPPPRRTRSTQMDREALLRSPSTRRRRRISPFSFAVLAILGILLIGLGLLLLWDQTLSNDDGATDTPSNVIGAAATATMRPASRTPSGPTATQRPPQSPPPTWTPTKTPTPTVTPTVTPTPPPLSGYQLLSTRQRGDESANLYTLKADGTGGNLLPVNLSESDQAAGMRLLAAFDAAYSPDGSQIAFSARVQSNDSPTGGSTYDIFMVPAAGGTIERVTNLQAARTESVTWSPNGDQLAFAADTDGDFDIYVVALDGGTPVNITNNDGEDRDPAWSPTSDTIVFATELAGPGELEIYSMTSTGDAPTRLTNNTNSSFAPSWSPDGTQIVFVSSRRGNNDLYIMNAAGQGERAILVRDVEAEEFDPAWSPDGKWIVFSSNREGTALDLFVIRPDGSELQRLTTGDTGVDTRHPDWKP